MRKILAVVVALAGACVSVDATRIRKDLYVVSVRGNAIGGQGEAIAAANQRAGELCPNGYEIQDSAAGSTSAYLRTSYGYQQIRRPEITLVVRCDHSVAAPPRAPARPVEAGAVAVTRWSCFEHVIGLGLCYRDPALCETSRSSSAASDPGVTACRPQPVAHCFGVGYPGLPASDDSCHPTETACNEQRDFVIANPDKATALTACRPID